MQWDLKFQVMEPDEAFPKLHNYTVETRCSPSYYCEGRRRSAPTCLFDLTLAGRGVFRDAGGEHEMTPGKAFLCVLNDPETSYYYPKDAREPWTFLWICLSGGLAKEMLSTLISRHGPVCEMPVAAGYPRRILSLRKTMSGLVHTPPAESARMAMELLSAVESAMVSKDGGGSAKDDMVMKAQRMALGSIESGGGVLEAAAALGVSREHLSRVFSERTGESFAGWLLRQRMAHAARLLKDGRTSCKEIAWRLGYGSPSNFSRAFLKSTGLAPSQFRRSGSVLLPS